MTEFTAEDRLFMDEDGDVCITGREDNLVFCPAIMDCDIVAHYMALNPDVVAEIIYRFNIHHELLERANQYATRHA